MASSPITSWQIDGGKVGTVTGFIFLGSKITADCSHEVKRHLLLERKAVTNLENILESRAITLPTKVYIVKAMVLSSYHVQMWESDHEEGWAPKNWYFQTVVLKTILESPLDSREIKPDHPKENQPWIHIGRTDAEAEAPVLCLPDAKSWLTGKDPDWERLKAKGEGVTEDEMVGWHHWMDTSLSKLREIVKE